MNRYPTSDLWYYSLTRWFSILMVHIVLSMKDIQMRLDGMTWTRMYISDQSGSSGREKKRDFSRIIPINVQRIKMEYEEKTTQSMKPIARRSERFFVQRCRFFDDDFFDASILWGVAYR